jgi:hypothetical protein
MGAVRIGDAGILTPPATRRYSFYDGPPFATGLPHYGHILAGTIKVCTICVLLPPSKHRPTPMFCAHSPLCRLSHMHAVR